MNSVLLKSLTLKGFKGFKEGFKFDFSEGLNQFLADNGQGKSSIGDGIAWVLTGRNAAGASRNLNVKNNESTIAEGELVFEDEMKVEHVLSRRMTKTTNTIKLDDKAVTVNELNELISPEVFLMAFNPVYFLLLDTPAQKRLITKTLPKIDVDDVLSQMSEAERTFLASETFQVDDTQTYLKNKQDELGKVKDSLIEIKGRMSILEVPIEVPQAQTFDETVLQTKKGELEALIAQTGASTPSTEGQTQAIQALEEQLKLVREKVFPQQSELKLTRANYTQLEKDIARTKQEVFKAELNPYSAEKLHLREMYNTKHSSYKALVVKLEEVSKAVETTCPTCSGVLPAEKIESLKFEQAGKVENLTTEKESLESEMEALVAKGKESADNEKKFDEAQAKAKAEFEKKQADDLASLEKDLAECLAEGQALNAASSEFLEATKKEVAKLADKIEKEKERLKQVMNTGKNEDLQKQVSALKSEIASLEKVQSDVMSQNVYVKTMQKQEAKRVEDVQAIVDKQKTLDETSSYLQEAIHYIKQFNSKRIELMHRTLDAYLKDVSIRLEKIVPTTGELKDCFDIEYKGKPLNICSTAENIKAGLEVVGMISGLEGLNYPVFIDNAESITKYHTTAKQIIEVRVEEGVELADTQRNRRVQRVVV